MRFALVIAVAAVLASSAAATGPFSMKTLAGTWTGSWTNETFGSAGPVTLVATPLANSKLRLSVDFGGEVFGCSSVPPESTTLSKGTGANHWGSTGFLIKGASKDFGSLTLRYRAGIRALTGSGVNPPCAHRLSWSVIGAFFGSTFTGKVKIKLASGQTAISSISLTRD